MSSDPVDVSATADQLQDLDLQVEHPVAQYALVQTLTLPTTWQITALTFGHAGHLYCGSNNGDLRVYDLSTYKVIKAVKGMGKMITGIVCVKRPGSEYRDAWVAAGKKIYRFRMDTEKIIQEYEDAIESVQVLSEDLIIDGVPDEVQDLAINWDKTHLAFGTDSGAVGIMEIATKTVTMLKNKHDIMCGSVAWVPERPRELISGGCDATLFHTDIVKDEVISRQSLVGLSVPEDKIAMAPPFIMSLSFAPNGILASGTADGRLFLGFGGMKGKVSSKSKKKGRWNGLDLEVASVVSVAEAPIVAVAFHSDCQRLTVSTLKGSIMHYNIIYRAEEQSVIMQKLWEHHGESIKVNDVAVDDKRIIVGGFQDSGRGVIDIWRLMDSQGQQQMVADEEEKDSE